MTLKEYIEQMWQFALYPNSGNNMLYPELGLLSEVGELAGEAKRVIRDDNGVLTTERREKMIDELGDIMWYLAAVSHEKKSEEFMTTFESVIQNENTNNPGAPQDINDFLKSISSLPETLYGQSADDQKFCSELNGLIKYLNTTLEEVLTRNLNKLQSRKERNKIQGEGGTR